MVISNKRDAAVLEILRRHAGHGGHLMDRFYGPERAAVRAAVLSEVRGEPVAKSHPDVRWTRWRGWLLIRLGIDRTVCPAEQTVQMNRLLSGSGYRTRSASLGTPVWVVSTMPDGRAHVLTEAGDLTYLDPGDLVD
jgi:hypothetical protein